MVAFVTVVAGLGIATAPVQAQSASRDAPSDPRATGCSSTAYTVESVPVYTTRSRKVVLGHLQNRYSEGCGTNWARFRVTRTPANCRNNPDPPANCTVRFWLGIERSDGLEAAEYGQFAWHAGNSWFSNQVWAATGSGYSARAWISVVDRYGRVKTTSAGGWY